MINRENHPRTSASAALSCQTFPPMTVHRSHTTQLRQRSLGKGPPISFRRAVRSLLASRVTSVSVVSSSYAHPPAQQTDCVRSLGLGLSRISGLFALLSYNAYAIGATATSATIALVIWDKRKLDTCTRPDQRVSHC